MAGEQSTDIFMFFREKDGSMPLRGECTTELNIPGKKRNDLYTGFEKEHMFEVSQFSFGVGVDDPDDEEDANGLQPELKQAMGQIPGFKFPKRFARTIKKPGQRRDDTPVSVHPVTFSRGMDVASSLLLAATIQRTYFKRVALVKRKSAGGAAAGEPYLRMDFCGALLIQASWTNDEPVKETYEFHARSITMRYRPQLEDGSLGAPRVGFWSMVPNEKEAKL